MFGFDLRQPPEGRYVSVDGIIHLLSRNAAEALIGLAEQFELIWCSGWEEKADEYLPLALGLPAGLRHLSFEPGEAARPPRHWKLGSIDSFAGRHRPLAWVDDAHDQSCHMWAEARPGPTLLVTTDPATGLTSEQAAQLSDWAARL